VSATPEQVELLSATLARRVAILPAVSEVRQRGFRAAVFIGVGGRRRHLAAEVAMAARRRGAKLPVRGDALVLAPSPSISDAELCRLVAVLASSIAEVSVGQMAAAA
jgi:adenosylmethionine-8-amino-7-oxononanoate aminotransferase